MMRGIAVVTVLTLVLVGCTSGPQVRAPVSSEVSGAGLASPVSQGTRTRIHRVRRGDTLYAIAWRYGLDYKDLARWNGVGKSYTIYPDQPLFLADPGIDWRRTESAKPPQSVARPAPSIPSPRRRPAARGSNASGGAPITRWAWPTVGRIVKTFIGTKKIGIDIAGKPGQDVLAAADGKVVYSGSGLRGYGQLIIVKHNKRFLSAYAHNKKLLVIEGDEVVRGQRIAEMGDTGSDRVKLHFEIRRDGQPVDPISYLPPKPG